MNKKFLIMICISAVLMTVGCFISYNKGYNDANIQANDNNSLHNDIYSKIDYPLIDIYFGDDSEWIIVYRENMFSQDERYLVHTNKDAIEKNKEHLKIVTFPVGRGITPNGELYVYKDGELIKEIPYLEIYFENRNFADDFRLITKEKLETLIKEPLPSPI